MITLYDFTMAPSPRRARIVLAEKGIPHEKISVDLAKGEQMGDSYRAINPRCTVPALRLENGHILTDNAGIVAWADAQYPNPPLLGTSPIEKADIASWNARIEFEALYAIADALRNSAPSMKDRALTGPVNYPQIPALAERGIARITAFMDMFNAHLAGRDFVVTDRFTVADITAVVAIDFARVIKIKPQESHADLLRWRAALAARPSISA